MSSKDRTALIISLFVVLVSLIAVSIFLYGDYSIRGYYFEFEDRPESVVLTLEAPNGFDAGNDIVVKNFSIRNDAQKVSTGEVIEIFVLRGDVQLTSPDIKSSSILVKAEEGFSSSLNPDQQLSKGDSFILRRGMSLGTGFGYQENSTKEISYSDRKRLRVGSNDRLKFLLALIALIGLFFSVYSGVKDFIKTRLEVRGDTEFMGFMNQDSDVVAEDF